MHPREVQPGGHNCLEHPHTAVERGSRGTGVPQVCKPSGLSFARLVPACLVPPAPGGARAPRVCQRQSRGQTPRNKAKGLIVRSEPLSQVITRARVRVASSQQCTLGFRLVLFCRLSQCWLKISPLRCFCEERWLLLILLSLLCIFTAGTPPWCREQPEVS